MISDKLIHGWMDEGDLKTKKNIFLCEISLCANQQMEEDSALCFTINDLVKIAGKVYSNYVFEQKSEGEKDDN